jgi:transposase
MTASEQHRPDVVAARAAFREAQPALDAAGLVFVDECGVNVKLTRRYGRAHRSRRAVGHAPAAWGKNTTLLGAMTQSGLVALGRRLGGGTTKASFLAFVREDLCPVLRPGQSVVLDNLSAHHALEVRALIEAAGCRLLHVPPYSPDLNPIERAWSKLKAVLRGLRARTQEALEAAITAAAAAITSSDAANWIRGAGYQLPFCPLL